MSAVKSLHVSMEMWGSVFCLIMVVCQVLGTTKGDKKRRALVWMELSIALLLVMDSMAWLFRGYPGTVGYYMVRITNFIVFVTSDTILMLYHIYICRCIFGSDSKAAAIIPVRLRIVPIIGIIGVAMVVISQFNGMYYYFDELNFYHRSSLHSLSLIIPLIGMIIDLTILIQYRRRLSRLTYAAMLSYVILPFAATIILIFFYGVSLVNIAITISVIFMFVTSIVEQNIEYAQKEKEMYNLRVEMMLSQIGPHFIYNTLTTIKHLCKKDPQMAAQTVDEFAVYLRGNIDSLMNKKNIPFDKELNHVRNYLAIEKKRFGDRINVIYDIKESGFMIPALTLQPIAENARKYGITKKEGGGTIVIASEKTDSGWKVTVSDDGVGFDTGTPKNDGRMHVGVDNVRNRLNSMCGGTLDIKSRKDIGTTVIINIPDKPMPVEKAEIWNELVK